jgi:hypothetical protein
VTKIGLHIIGGTTLALGHPRVVKLVDVSPLYVRQVRSQVGANCLILIRWVEQHADWLRRGPGEWFDAHLSLMRAMADENVAFESLNEVPDEHARAYAQFEAERLRLMHGVRLRSVVGNWSVGVPDLGTWHVYQPALDAMDQADMAGVHEYWVDTVDIINPWHCGRWAMVPELHNRRIVVTECGRDVVDGSARAAPRSSWAI